MSQVGKNLGMLGGVTVGAVALGLYAYFGVMKGDEQEAKTKEVSAQVFPAATAQGPSAPSGFKKLTVVAEGQTTVLAHDAQGWRLTSPVEAQADAETVDGIVSALTHDTFKQIVDDHPSKEDLAKYGLDLPKFQVTAVFQKPSGPAETITLAGGIENPFDGSIYVRRSGEEAVHAINGAFKASVEKSTFELRDKRLVPFEESALQGIDLRGQGGAIALALDGTKHWRMTAPLQEPADEPAVKALWNALQTNRARSFPADTPDARKDFGLTAPVLEATFTPRDGAPVTIAFGEKGAGANRHAFADVNQGTKSTLAEIPPALIDALAQKPDALRDHTVLAFDEKQVQRIRYQAKAGDPVLELARGQAKGDALADWQITAPKKEKAQGWKVSSMLWTLRALQAAGFGPVHPDERAWAKHGIDAKARTITLLGDGDQVLARLVLGASVKGKADHLWAQGSRDQVLELEVKSLDPLPKSMADLADTPPPATRAATPQASSKP